MQLGRANLIVVHLRDTEKTKNVVKCRTPQVVEFAVRPPAPPAKLSPSKGIAQPIFPARQKLRGDIRSSEVTAGWPRPPEFEATEVTDATEKM
jgi:hypothetical protein